jgi:hypothetical protein
MKTKSFLTITGRWSIAYAASALLAFSACSTFSGSVNPAAMGAARQASSTYTDYKVDVSTCGLSTDSSATCDTEVTGINDQRDIVGNDIVDSNLRSGTALLQRLVFGRTQQAPKRPAIARSPAASACAQDTLGTVSWRSLWIRPTKRLFRQYTLTMAHRSISRRSAAAKLRRMA